MNLNTQNNFFVLLADAVAFSMFFTLWDVNTVIPLFLDYNGVPPWGIGSVAALKQLSLLIPQLFMATQLWKLNKQISFIRKVMLLDRSQLLIFLIILLISCSGKTVLFFFITSFTIFCFGEGLTQIPWWDLLSRTVNPKLRGRFWSIMQIATGLAALCCGYAVAKIIDNPNFPYPSNFLLIFGAGIFLLLPSLFFYRLAGDPIITYDFTGRYKKPKIFDCLADKDFVRLVIVQLLVNADLLALPYYILSVHLSFPWLTKFTGSFVFLCIAGGILGGFIWGFLSDRKGNRKTIICVALCKTLTAGIFLSTQLVDSRAILPFLLGSGFVLSGMATGGWLGFVNYIMDLTVENNRPFYIAFNNTALLPLAVLPVVGGIIIENAGEIILYTTTLMTVFLGLIISFVLKEPRRNS